MKTAKLADGRELQFPDDTAQEVIDRVAKEETAKGAGNPGTITEDGLMRTIKEGVVNEGPGVGGGIVAGLAAGGAGVSGIPLAGVVAFGAAAGEAFKQIGQHLSGSLAAPKTSLEAAKRIASFGVEEGTWELVGGLAVRGFGKILSPFKKKMVEGAEGVVDFFKEKVKPVVLLPAEATESRVLDILHNVSESSIIGGGTISQYKTARLKFFDDFADSMIDEFGKRTDPTDLGNLFVASIESKWGLHKEAANVLYNNVSEAIAQIPERVVDVPLSGKGIVYRTADGGFTSYARQAKSGGGGGPVFYRGTGSVEQMHHYSPGVKMYAARSEDVARKYGPNIEKVRIKPTAKVLYEESPEFGELIGVKNYNPSKGLYQGNLSEVIEKYITKESNENEAFVNFVVEKAKRKGYDVVSFSEDYLLGTAIINERAITKGAVGGGEAFQLPPNSTLLNLDTQRGSRIFKEAERKAAEANKAMRESGVAKPVKRTVMDEIADLGYAGTSAGKGKTIAIAPGVQLQAGKKVIPAGTVAISTKSLKEFAQQVGVKAKDLGGLEAKNAGDDLVDAIMDLPDEVSFDTMRELRSRLLSRVDEFNVLNKKAPAIGKAKKLISISDEAIEQGLGEHPDVLDSWRTANRFYKEGSEKFNSTVIRRLIKLADETGTGAEMIAPAIFKPGQVSRVRRVKEALNPDEWKKMQGFFMQHIMQKSTDVDGMIVGKRILNNLEGKPGSFGSEMINTVFSREQVETLNKFGTAVKLAQEKAGEGSGKVLIQLTQAGAMGAILTGNAELPAATVIFGPAILSKMMLNPTVCRWLTTGLTLPAKSPEAGGLMARLIAASHRITEEEANAAEKKPGSPKTNPKPPTTGGGKGEPIGVISAADYVKKLDDSINITKDAMNLRTGIKEGLKTGRKYK